MCGHFEIIERRIDTVDIIAVSGRLDAGTPVLAEERINRVLDAGGKCLLINLCDLDYISSSGLRVLLAALKRLKKDGGTLRIACGNPQILEVFTMAGFHRIFSIYNDEAAALTELEAGP